MVQVMVEVLSRAPAAVFEDPSRSGRDIASCGRVSYRLAEAHTIGTAPSSGLELELRSGPRLVERAKHIKKERHLTRPNLQDQHKNEIKDLPRTLGKLVVLTQKIHNELALLCSSSAALLKCSVVWANLLKLGWD